MGLNPNTLPINVLRAMGNDQKMVDVNIQAAPPKSDSREEKAIQRHILDWLRIQRIPYLHDATHKRRTGTVGWPDITFAVEGIPFALEVKTWRGVLSPEQEAMIVKLAQHGWRACVVRSLDEAIYVVREAVKHGR